MTEDGRWLEGRLGRVVWASDSGPYAVLQIEREEGSITAVGDLALLTEAEEGTFVALEGRYESHTVHGRQFRAVGFLLGSPRTLEGLKLYLASSRIPGVGPRLAARIVDRFGMHTLELLATDPQRLREVDGVGQKKVEQIAARWRVDEEDRATSILLRGLGLSGRLVDRIRRRYRGETARVVSHHPYRLAEEISGVGFRTADRIALAQGLAADHPDRVRAALLHCLERASDDGHCFLPYSRLERAVGALEVPTHGLEDALEAALADGKAVVEHVDGDRAVWWGDLHAAEDFVARELRARVVQPELGFDVERRIDAAERAEGLTLDPSQRDAIRVALGGGVVVVTGGPGTGKTTLLKVLLRAVGADDWLLASPTGRAAKRLQEATGREAMTLHRLLEFNPGEGGFQRNLSNPLEGSGLIVDEASMVDLLLLRALLEGLPHPDQVFGLVLVGDADQLPSVGPGQVLRDLITSGVVPVARLEVVHRQASGSRILTAAHAIRAGQLPTSGSSGEDFFLIERERPEALLDTLLKVMLDRLPANGFQPDEVQVLTPTRKGPLGTRAVNALLQRRVNDGAEVVREGENELREGDRVICTRNRYDLEVFNGDLGVVRRKVAGGLQIRFDGRDVDWPWEELDGVELAYAITVHKAQGSEYPAVVVLLHPSHGIMLRRNLFYTALTRARRFLVVLGAERGWVRAVRTVDADERFTRLAARLHEG